VLKIRTPTQLTRRERKLLEVLEDVDGKFPFWEVYQKIDGQTEVRAHGTREMPVWGGPLSGGGW
jgi:hypothetical protein